MVWLCSMVVVVHFLFFFLAPLLARLSALPSISREVSSSCSSLTARSLMASMFCCIVLFTSSTCPNRLCSPAGVLYVDWGLLLLLSLQGGARETLAEQTPKDSTLTLGPIVDAWKGSREREDSDVQSLSPVHPVTLPPKTNRSKHACCVLLGNTPPYIAHSQLAREWPTNISSVNNVSAVRHFISITQVRA